jgi:hypothetical protein
MIEIIPQTEKYAQIADAIVARTYEVYSYDTNITNYQHVLDSIGNIEWTDTLLPFRFVPPHDAVAQIDVTDIELLSKLQQVDRFSVLIKSEMLERDKSQGILNALIAQLPVDQYDTLVQAAIDRRNNIQ